MVTGGSSGIGRAIAKKMAQENIKVVVADLNDYKEEEKNIFYKKCDVSRAEDINELYKWMKNNVGKPHFLILNAGQGIQEKLTEGDPEKWQKIIDTNLMGALRCVRSFVPEMLKKQEGNVVFISSVAANQPHEYGGIYSATKTALEVVAETLRLETAPHINVTVISPGIVESNFFENQISGENSIENIGMGSIAAEEIAEDVWYAINKRKGTAINKIITRPTSQTF